MPKTCSDRAGRSTLHGPTMGTRWSATIDADAALDLPALERDLDAAVGQVDAQMSPWKPDSSLTRLNRAAVGAWVELPQEMQQVLACALDIERLSGGAFDAGVGALVDAWGFGAPRDAPDAAAIRSAREAKRPATHASLELDLAAQRARKHAPLQVDLCGIAKGYAVDRMADVLQRHGVRHALAALDGELRAIGAQADGAPWPIALERPEPGRRAVHGVIELDDLAIATSGDYRHFVDVGGVRLAHTIDGRRGAPLANDVASVSVLAKNCMHADAWATALLVAGPGAGLALAQRMGLEALWLLRRAGKLVEVGVGRFGTPSSGLVAPAPVAVNPASAR